jgi:hypothetical protein
MMTRERLIAGVVCLIFSATTSAQCVTALQTVKYDTLVTGSGNNLNTFTFPKFDPTLGTLTEVDINAQVTLSYSFQLENREINPVSNYRVRVVREHEISSDAIASPLTSQELKTYGIFSLAGADGSAGSGPDYITQGPMFVMDHKNIGYTLYNTADFMGAGTVNFDYSTNTYSIVFGSVNNSINGTALDTIAFSITYKFCTTWFLDVNISTFTAKRKDNSIIDLQWFTHNEKNDRHYELQKSVDGRNFTRLADFAATASATATGAYSYQYQVQPNDNGKLIFRVKQIEKDGTEQYSPLRIIDLKTNTGQQPRLFPNPANGPVTLVFNNQKRNDWDVEILTAGGQVLDHYLFKNALLARLNNHNELPKGLYFIRSVNRKTQEQFLQRLLVQ